MGNSINIYSKDIKVNEFITIHVPSVGEAIDKEDEYFEAISLIISTPYAMMAQLDEMGIDFTTIDDWQLFNILFPVLQEIDTSLIFKDIDLKEFYPGKNTDSNEVVLFNPETGAVIDRLAHYQMADILRKVLFIEKQNKKPGNEEAKEYLLYKAKKELKKRRRKMANGQKEDSQFQDALVALVNREEFPYTYETVKDITVYQFYSSLYQIVHKVNYDNLMHGCYAGTVDVKSVNKTELSWLKINE